MNITFKGMVFWNRVIWIGVGILTMVIGYLKFNFNVVNSSRFKKKVLDDFEESDDSLPIPIVYPNFGLKTYLLQISRQSRFYFNYIIKSIPFLAIAGFGFLLMAVNSFSIGEIFDTPMYPTTYLILETITGDFTVFFIIIIVFYSGELVWRERDVRIHYIQDALPVPDFVNLLSKFIGLVLVFVVTLLFLIVIGVLIQSIMGYFRFDLFNYFSRLFGETLSVLILFSGMAFFIQVMVNKKFLAHALFVIFFFGMAVLDVLGLQHNLFQFGGGTMGIYSEMNGYGHFLQSFIMFDLYWFAFISMLFAIALVFTVRGTDSNRSLKWNVRKLRITRPLIILATSSLLFFVVSGIYIYYNTNVLNTFRSSNEIEAFQAGYEKALKKYEFIKQPKIIATRLKMDIYPDTRDYSVNGVYVLKNLESDPIKDIHIQLSQDHDAHYKKVIFSKPSTVIESYKDFSYFIHQLETPLETGDSIELNFKLEYITRGFKEDLTNTSIVYNGTFLNNMEFPSLGYSETVEISSDNKRKSYGLSPKSRMMTRENPEGLVINFVSDDSHGTDFEIIVGTAAEQIAVAPGYLQKEWIENDRRYFHYKMDQPMIPFFGIVSAKYEVLKDKVRLSEGNSQRNIDLEIYYHKGHEYNLESMMQGMKNSLIYFSENFGAYQFNQMRILEYPRYGTNAQSFANTVPFSEGVGFMAKVKDENDIDVAYFVTAHEMAHQWWGHQLHGANVQGSGVFSETLAQYSALMVMKQNYPEEKIREFLKQELNRYLIGRTAEEKKEMPLALAENQQYILYAKGVKIMYALQDYIGEDKVNAALRCLLQDWTSFETRGRYVTTNDFLGYLREVTPDSLQNFITDSFEKIILYENLVKESTYTKISKDEYWVDLKFDARKIEADSLGNITDVGINDWMDVGVYSKDGSGDEKLIYLKKHFFNNRKGEHKIKVDQLPSSAGIDPLIKLIDRNPGDNTINLIEIGLK